MKVPASYYRNRSSQTEDRLILIGIILLVVLYSVLAVIDYDEFVLTIIISGIAAVIITIVSFACERAGWCIYD